MKLLLSGSSGLIGSALASAWQTEGHTCIRLVRTAALPDSPHLVWDPTGGAGLDGPLLEGLDAVVHLAGRTIACRWTEGNRRAIRDSRIRGTALLARALANLTHPPPVFLSASATGFYGDTGDRPVDEAGHPGSGFLAGVCREWEAATSPAAQAGIRVVHLRTGAVLSPDGGMLGKILPVFRTGFGGRMGSGRQFMSWITLPDILGAIRLIIETDALRGPVNLVSPKPVTNQEFTRVLARALSRPAILPVPGFAVRAVLGQMAEETALVSSRVVPGLLTRHNYSFVFPDLAGALAGVL